VIKFVSDLQQGWWLQVNYWLRDTNDDLAIYKRFIRFLVKDGIIPTHGIVIGLKYDSYTTFDVQVFNVTFGTKKRWPYMTGDLLKEVQFI
jgi:hypothetical protein